MIIGLIMVLLLIILISLITYNTINMKPISYKDELVKLEDNVDIEHCVESLREAIKFKTISYNDTSKIDYEEFKSFHLYIKERYPNINEKLDLKVINEFGLLYHWKGKDSNIEPCLFLAHQDVVPVDMKALDQWKRDPFAGEIEKDYVYGRGALDMKVQLITYLETVELLLKESFVPKGDIYFAFGQDEEVGGENGAKKIVEYLKNQNIKFSFIFDEGGAVTKGSIEGIDIPLALIGIAEKGMNNIEVTYSEEGGHASMPPKHTAVGKLSQLTVNLEEKKMKSKITIPVKEFFRHLGPHMSLLNKIIVSNLWLFNPLFKYIFSKNSQGNAMLRTTFAATMTNGSNAPNVLPKTAKGVFNVRISHHQSTKEIVEYINKNSIEECQIRFINREEASNISPTDSKVFKKIAAITEEMYDSVIVSPYLMVGGTDARHYQDLSKQVYRFSAYCLTKEELNSIHNINERISVENIKRMLVFFKTFMKDN